MSGASEFGKDNGLIHETVVTGRKAGWDRDVWSKLAENEELMRTLLSVIRGQARVEVLTHVVDCSLPAKKVRGLTPLPDSEQITSRFMGQLTLTPEAIGLHLDPGQKDGVVVGNELRKLLEGQKVKPANLLDYYLEHQALIPEAWKEKVVFFWGTIYRDSDGSLCVRCLRWDGRRWFWSYRWLDNGWHARHRAAVLVG